MKSSTGMLELVIIIAFIVAATPLLVSLIRTGNASKYNYLDDKTVYDMANSVEYQYDAATNTYYPVNLAPIHVDAGGMQLIALIQDDYCPESGKKIDYAFDVARVDGTNVAGNAVTPTASLEIVRGWYTRRFNAYADMHTKVWPAAKAKGVTNTYYMIWDYAHDKWIITNEFVNVLNAR